MRIRTQDLHTAALDYAVHAADRMQGLLAPVPYSERWEFAGPFMERGRIGVYPDPERGWAARSFANADIYYGVTPRIALLRCYVANNLGDEVEVPDDIVGEQA